MVVAPPALYIAALKSSLSSEMVQLAVQNLSDKPSGAYTGELSIAMLQDLNIPWAIIGHSERRKYYHESDEEVGRKLAAIMANNAISAVLCIGETLEERQAGLTEEVVTRQLKVALEAVPEGQLDTSRLVIAYEPVWAIGTGQVATKEQAQQVHASLRSFLAGSVGASAADSLRIIYGGSVTGSNCLELVQCEDIDGFLVGGACLKPEFVHIIKSCV